MSIPAQSPQPQQPLRPLAPETAAAVQKQGATLTPADVNAYSQSTRDVFSADDKRAVYQKWGAQLDPLRDAFLAYFRDAESGQPSLEAAQLFEALADASPNDEVKEMLLVKAACAHSPLKTHLHQVEVRARVSA